MYAYKSSFETVSRSPDKTGVTLRRSSSLAIYDKLSHEKRIRIFEQNHARHFSYDSDDIINWLIATMSLISVGNSIIKSWLKNKKKKSLIKLSHRP